MKSDYYALSVALSWGIRYFNNLLIVLIFKKKDNHKLLEWLLMVLHG
jgi:hypothetical protein